MATLFTHPAIAIGLIPFFGKAVKSKAIIFSAIILTLLPDLDVIGFRLGVPYADLFGHRGFTHSLFFAVVVAGILSWLFTRPQKIYFFRIWLYLALCTASHGILDAFTNGGLGVAFFSPFSNERHFFSFTPIEVSTLNLTHFFQGQGIPVIKSELIWVWLPSLITVTALLSIKLLHRLITK